MMEFIAILGCVLLWIGLCIVATIVALYVITKD